MKTLLFALAVAIAALAIDLPAQQAPERGRPPQAGPPPALKLPAVQKRQLSNGLGVWVVELHEVPIAEIHLVVLTGTTDDPAGRFGVASLATAMLVEGAGSRSSLDIADAVDFLGAELEATSGIDFSVVRLHVPVARLAAALPIMADVVERPTFPSSELERLRRERLTNILQARDNAATVNSLAFSRVLFGPAHRYGTAATGSAESIRSITLDDVRAFYGAAFQPKNAALLIVGDVTAETATPLLEASFGTWKNQAAPPPKATLPPVQPPAARTIYLVDKPGAPQTQIRIGSIGVARSTPDYFPIQVMNSILGGSYSSRLNMNLREKHGYTYGAASAFDMRAATGLVIAAAGVQTDKTAEALKEFFNEFNGMLKPVPEDEVTRARNYIALSFPSGFETTRDISRQLEEALVYRLPDDYFSRYVQNIEAVTAADVQRMAQKYIQPGRFAIVITGDRKVIEPAVRALNMGTIKVMTVDDVFGPPPALTP